MSSWMNSIIISLSLLTSACSVEGQDVDPEERDPASEGDALIREEKELASASSEEVSKVPSAWTRCQRSVTTVTAYKAPTGTAAWGTYRSGLTFAYMGESNGRFANWWGPGDAFPGKGTAWINLNQTVMVTCPF